MPETKRSGPHWSEQPAFIFLQVVEHRDDSGELFLERHVALVFLRKRAIIN